MKLVLQSSPAQRNTQHGLPIVVRTALLIAFLFTVTVAAAAAPTKVQVPSSGATPGPSLNLCKIDKSLNAPDLQAMKGKYIALCLDHQIRLMNQEEKLFQIDIDNYQKSESQDGLMSVLSNSIYGDQLWENKAIFGLVLIIVACGLIFSWMQLAQGFKHHEEHAAALSKLTETPDSTKALQDVVKFGSLEVRSTTLGVTILALAIVFFFLYLEFVYKISVTSPGGS